VTTEHLVDPELKPILRAFPQWTFSLETLPVIRSAVADFIAAIPARAGLPVEREVVTVPGAAGGSPLRLLWYRPTEARGPLPALLHIHGGGYVVGTPEMSDAANRGLVADLGCAIFSVDYRLAPETRAPGAVEDCYAALEWMSRNARMLDIDPQRIGVKGESAGGGLAAALTLLVRDRGTLRLAFQHLIYPMLDDRTCVRSDLNPFTGEFAWNAEQNRFGWSSLLGVAPGTADLSPYAAPARETNLRGLPPAFLYVGALDLFLDEDLDYARRLLHAGVPVELHVYRGATHGFEQVRSAGVTQAAERDSIAALRRAMWGNT
jgi:triacylglycerol lipase